MHMTARGHTELWADAGSPTSCSNGRQSVYGECQRMSIDREITDDLLCWEKRSGYCVPALMTKAESDAIL